MHQHTEPTCILGRFRMSSCVTNANLAQSQAKRRDARKTCIRTTSRCVHGSKFTQLRREGAQPNLNLHGHPHARTHEHRQATHMGHTQAHAYTHAHTHTHTRTHTHTYTHTHTHREREGRVVHARTLHMRSHLYAEDNSDTYTYMHSLTHSLTLSHTHSLHYHLLWYQ